MNQDSLRACCAGIVALALTLGASLMAGSVTVSAQQRPLVTEDPESVGSGVVLVEAGVEYLRDTTFVLSGLRGHLVRVPAIGISVGVSSIAEVQVDGLSGRWLHVTERFDAPHAFLLTFDGDRSADVDDLVVATKVRMVSESARRPALGLRFATRLPNTGTGSGMGLETTDFSAAILVGKTIRAVRVVGNVGIAILNDPTNATRQNDVTLLGVSLARAVLPGVDVVAEINGHVNSRDRLIPTGTESSGAIRAGLRLTRGSFRLDGAVVVGVTSRDPVIGATTGLTWVFRAFDVP